MSATRCDPIRLIVFDLGRVLVEIARDWADAAKMAGIPFPGALEKTEVREGVRRLSHAHETGQIDDATFFRQTATVTGLAPPEVEAVSRAWIREPFEGVDALLADLARGGIPLACLSNTNRFHWSLMSRHPPTRRLLDRMGRHFTSHALGAVKPDAAVYQHVEREAGLPGREILYFDDHPPNTDAAAARGWQAVRVMPDEPPAVQMRRTLRAHDLL